MVRDGPPPPKARINKLLTWRAAVENGYKRPAEKNVEKCEKIGGNCGKLGEIDGTVNII